jgi:AraC-like DNA-binding protein
MLVANPAKHYLLDPSLELAETACLLGYEDPNSFFPAFREREGTTPGEWSRCRPICVNSQAGLHARYELLTPREREVMRLVVRGLLNKEAAGDSPRASHRRGKDEVP